MHYLLGLLALLGAHTATAQADNAPQLPDSLVYAVMQSEQTAFRAEPDLNAEVVGYFPPYQAVWLVRTEDDWAQVHFRGVTGWVETSALGDIFTLDPQTLLPL